MSFKSHQVVFQFLSFLGLLLATTENFSIQVNMKVSKLVNRNGNLNTAGQLMQCTCFGKQNCIKALQSSLSVTLYDARKKNILKAKNRRNILSIVLTEQNFSMELNEYIF